MLHISKIFESILFGWNVCQCFRISNKSYCVIPCENLDIIYELFKYSNPLFFKLESHT